MADETTPVPAPDGAVPAIPVPPVPVLNGQPIAAPLTPSSVTPAPVTAAPVVGAVPVAGGTVPPTGAPRKRPVWPFVLGGGILLLVLLIAGVGVLLVNLLGTLSPSKTVTEFDRSFAEVNCELFQKSTTTDFQENFFGEKFTCAPWEDNARKLQVDGEYAYKVALGTTTVDGNRAEVRTTETDSTGDKPAIYRLEYHLVNTGGTWLIDSIEDLDG